MAVRSNAEWALAWDWGNLLLFLGIQLACIPVCSCLLSSCLSFTTWGVKIMMLSFLWSALIFMKKKHHVTARNLLLRKSLRVFFMLSLIFWCNEISTQNSVFFDISSIITLDFNGAKTSSEWMVKVVLFSRQC